MTKKPDATPTDNLRSPEVTKADAYRARFPELDYEDFLRPGEPVMQGQRVAQSAAVAARQRAAKGVKNENGDPLKLQGSGKQRRKAAQRREDMQRKHLSYLLQMKSITPDMFRAAMHLHELSLVSTGGMQAMDWTRERVDGGGISFGGRIGGALDAERELKTIFRVTGIGVNQVEIVLRVVCDEQSILAVGQDFASRPGSPIKGGGDREIRGYVGALLRDALTEIHKYLFPKTKEVDDSNRRSILRRWLSDDAVPADRPDLRDPKVFVNGTG